MPAGAAPGSPAHPRAGGHRDRPPGHHILFDGLSASESFFMEALYDSGRFPCLFVGGSAGGKFDFRNTWLHDGTRRLENHALIAFLKVARGTRFGVLKSQNFVPDGPTSRCSTPPRAALRERGDRRRRARGVLHRRPVRAPLLRPGSSKQAGRLLLCDPGRQGDLRALGGAGRCRGRAGVFLLRHLAGRRPAAGAPDQLVQSTERISGLHGRQARPPVAGILNDCILRRLYNDKDLARRGAALRQLAGFSTFGEILGLNLNQTLTAVFFFRVPEGAPFRDDYVDNFVAHYGEFKAFFLRRQSAKLAGLSRVIVTQIDDYQAQRFDSQLDRRVSTRALRRWCMASTAWADPPVVPRPARRHPPARRMRGRPVCLGARSAPHRRAGGGPGPATPSPS
jgi:hypothetical protein